MFIEDEAEECTPSSEASSEEEDNPDFQDETMRSDEEDRMELKEQDRPSVLNINRLSNRQGGLRKISKTKAQIQKMRNLADDTPRRNE